MAELAAALLAEIDRRAPEIVELTRELVRTRSVNPRYPDAVYEDELGGESACTALLAERYAAAGFETTTVTAEPGRNNLVARLPGAGGGTSLAFNGHVDTVAAGDLERWSGSPWSGELANGRIHGLGAADMKGPVAAFTVACCALAELGVPLRGDLVAQCVCGEETGDDQVGTSACLPAGHADLAICAEPTGGAGGELALAPVSVGTLLLRVRVTGASVHAGRRREALYPLGGPRAGVSAAEKGLALVAALARLEHGWGFRLRSPHFPAGQFTINLGALDSRATGAGSAFFLPDAFQADFAVYYPPELEPADVRAEIERTIAAEAAIDEWLAVHPPQVDWPLDMPPARTGDGSAVHAALLAAIAQARGQAPLTAGAGAGVASAAAVSHDASAGGTPSVRGFPAGCDATWLDRAGIPTVIYGPGDLADAHRPNETVCTDHLVEAAKAYALTALRLCGDQGPNEETP